MNSWQSSQYIPISFKLIESGLFHKWPGGTFKLYIYMQRFVWRSKTGRLGTFYSQGLLCVEGYLERWANALNVSRATISRQIDWMKQAGIFWLIRDGYATGGIQPNIYVLGQIYDSVDGSADAIELFYPDYTDLVKQEKACNSLPSKVKFENGITFVPRFSGAIPSIEQASVIKDTRLVYFIRGANNSIKIGIAQDVVKRIKELQGGSSSEFELLAVARGGIEYEKELHDRFDTANIRGEWFKPVPELLELIDLHGEQGKGKT